jgi:hypothetical protein
MAATTPTLGKATLQICDILLDVYQHLLVVVQGVIRFITRPGARGAVRGAVPHLKVYLGLQEDVNRNGGLLMTPTVQNESDKDEENLNNK